jgi:hypothetical protein
VTPATIVRDLHHAAEQIPPADRAAEAEPLKAVAEKARRSHRGPQHLGTLLVAALARLGLEAADRNAVESD